MEVNKVQEIISGVKMDSLCVKLFCPHKMSVIGSQPMSEGS